MVGQQRVAAVVHHAAQPRELAVHHLAPSFIEVRVERVGPAVRFTVGLVQLVRELVENHVAPVESAHVALYIAPGQRHHAPVPRFAKPRLFPLVHHPRFVVLGDFGQEGARIDQYRFQRRVVAHVPVQDEQSRVHANDHTVLFTY